MAGKIKIMEIRRYSEVLKRRVVEEYESGSASVRELMAQYGILCKDSIYHWCKRYGRFKKVTKVVRVIMKSEKERILELERAVADLTLKNRVLETHVRILEREVGEEVKKKLSTNQLKKLENVKAKLVAIQSKSSVDVLD